MVHNLEGTVSEMVTYLSTFGGKPTLTVLFECFGTTFGIIASRLSVESPKTVPNHFWNRKRIGSTVSEVVLTKTSLEVYFLWWTFLRR